MSINYKNQKGASLIMVLAIMIVIALMIIATGKSTNVESRTSFDDTDKKASHMLAETSLVIAEQTADEYYQKHSDEIKQEIAAANNTNKTTYLKFRDGNDGIEGDVTENANKLIAKITEDATKQAWDVDGVFNKTADGTLLATPQDIKHDSFRSPLFIVEYFGEDLVRARVTVKAWGKGENNSTMLQSVIELSSQ